MGAVAVQISDKSFADFTTKNAWAKYVRNRWRTNTVCEVQREWGLTDGEARGVVYAQASQPTIDKIKRSRRGGPLLALQVEALFWGETLEGLLTRALEQERGRIANARAEQDAQEARLVAMARRVRVGLSLASGGAVDVPDAANRATAPEGRRRTDRRD